MKDNYSYAINHVSFVTVQFTSYLGNLVDVRNVPNEIRYTTYLEIVPTYHVYEWLSLIGILRQLWHNFAISTAETEWSSLMRQVKTLTGFQICLTKCITKSWTVIASVQQYRNRHENKSKQRFTGRKNFLTFIGCRPLGGRN